MVDRLTKLAHFIPIKIAYTLERLALLYIKEVLRLHGIPDQIISDRDPQFVSRFWNAFQEALGSKVSLSTAFQPQTDGQSERVIQPLKNMLHMCAIDFRGY